MGSQLNLKSNPLHQIYVENQQEYLIKLNFSSVNRINNHLHIKSALHKHGNYLFKFLLHKLMDVNSKTLLKAKIIKALSLIIDQNISLLKLPLVESTIYQCIHNSSKLIREAVIDLMGKFIKLFTISYVKYTILSDYY